MDLRGATVLATRIDEKLHHILLLQLMSSVKSLRGNWGEKFQPELTLIVDLFYQICKFDILRESPGLNAMSLSLFPDARSKKWLVFRKFALMLLLGTGYAYRRLSKIRGENQQFISNANTTPTTNSTTTANNNVSSSLSTPIQNDNNNNYVEESFFNRVISLPAIIYQNSLSGLSMFYSIDSPSIVDTGAKVVKVIDLINTLLFLLEGRYPTLLHRFLGESLTTHVSKDGPTTRKVSSALAYVIGRQVTLVAISELIRVSRDSTQWNSIKRFLGAWFLLRWRRVSSVFASTFSRMFNNSSNSRRTQIPEQTSSSNIRNIVTSTPADDDQISDNDDNNNNSNSNATGMSGSNLRQANANTDNETCSTCQQRIENPHASDCGHLHCYYCLTAALATSRMINTHHQCAACGIYNQSCLPFHNGVS